MTKVRAKQAKRSTRARSADASSTAKSTFSQSNRDGLGRWTKNPQRHDVSGVDTKGKGRAGIALYPGKAKPKRKKSTSYPRALLDG